MLQRHSCIRNLGPIAAVALSITNLVDGQSIATFNDGGSEPEATVVLTLVPRANLVLL